MGKKRRGYGYYRTSGEIGVKNRGYGYSTQQREVREYCKENNIELVGEFFSNGVSGVVFEDDTQLHTMFEKLEKGDVVISKSSCRLFGRDMWREMMTTRVLQERDVNVVLTDTPDYDLWETDETKKLMNDFIKLIDRYEKSVITSRLLKSRREKVMRGDKGNGTYPLGYKRVWNPTGGRYGKGGFEIEVNEKTKPIVQWLFQTYNPDNKNTSLSGLSREVKEKFGIPLTPRGIRVILSNKWYIGHTTMGDTINTEGNHETFITKNRFGRVQSMIRRRHG